MRRPSRERGRGQSLVEFVLVAPIILALLGASLDLARVFQAWITLQAATRDAAEYVATFATDEASAEAEARRIVCLQAQHLNGFQAGADPANCTSPTVSVTSWSRSTTAPGAGPTAPLASASVASSLGFVMLFPYPFLDRGTWTLTANQSYAILQGR